MCSGWDGSWFVEADDKRSSYSPKLAYEVESVGNESGGGE